MVDNKKRKRKPYRYAALAGVVLGLLCSSISVEYQTACEIVARALTLTCGA